MISISMQYTHPSHKSACTSSTAMTRTWTMIILMQLLISYTISENEQIITI